MKRQYEEPIHILHFTTKLGTGGVQSFLTNYAEHMDPKRVVFDFAVQTNEEQTRARQVPGYSGTYRRSRSDGQEKRQRRIYMFVAGVPEKSS